MSANKIGKRIVTAAEMRAIEADADQYGLSYAQMMINAGTQAVKYIVEKRPSIGNKAVFLIGTGNNGGDGLVAARVWFETHFETHKDVSNAVTLILLKPRLDDDPNWTALAPLNLPVIIWNKDDKTCKDQIGVALGQADIVFDALFGTGFKLPMRPEAAALLQWINDYWHGTTAPDEEPVPLEDVLNRHHIMRVALDLPSGMDADSGQVAPETLWAQITLTFGAAKLGMLNPLAQSYLNKIVVIDLDLPANLPAAIGVHRQMIPDWAVRSYLPERSDDSNKGTFGKVCIVAGSGNYVGAAALAATAAYKIGTGLVTVATPAPNVALLAPQLWEATWLSLPHENGAISADAVTMLHTHALNYSAWCVGPGLGTADATKDFINILFPADPAARTESHTVLPPLVVDADALNILAGFDQWWTRLPPDTIITPHPGEMGRLSGKTTAEVQTNRVLLAEECARVWNCTIVLKGAYTVIAAPDGHTLISPFSTSALAKAGTGDVLAGTIAGLRAQGMTAFDAAFCGVYIHAAAAVLATRYAAQDGHKWKPKRGLMTTARGLMAHDVAEWLPTAVVNLGLYTLPEKEFQFYSNYSPADDAMNEISV